MHLNDLYPEYPLFTSDNLRKLRAFHITTLSDLLAKDCEKIVNILDVSYTEVNKLIEELSLKYCGSTATVFDIYQKRTQSNVEFKSGASHLDSILQGGFKTGNIYEVFGCAGAGKTQLCFSVAVQGILHEKNVEVVYVDTKNDLAPERILQILQRRANGNGNVALLKKIHVYKCFDVEELIITLRLISERLKQKQNLIRLVIVDNLASTILGILNQDFSLGLSFISEISQEIHKISSSRACVMVVNNARIREGEIQPAMGKLWSNLANFRLKLEHNDTAVHTGSRKVTVTPCGTIKKQEIHQCSFSIDASGFS